MTTSSVASTGRREGGSPFEVFKHGWLKRLPPQERRLSVMTPFSRPPKAEKLWVAFCVHHQAEPWLEFYENRRSAFTHKPTSRLSLVRCLHVSPSIRFHEDNEHVLSVILEGENVKLSLQSREQMIEWMDALRCKLRELGILTPRDNLYSKEPEGFLRSPLLRNPNSPLPPTPAPAFLFPPPSGLEFREELSATSLQNSVDRHGVSPAPSITLSTMSCPSVSNPLPVGDHHPNTPSVVSYVRHHQDHTVNRRSSFRSSLPGSPSTPAPISFVRSPQGPQASPREHVTVINVAGSSGNVFNFDDVSAVLESSSGITSSQLYGAEDHDDLSSTAPYTSSTLSHSSSSNDRIAVQVRVGNSLGAGGSCSMYGSSTGFGNSMGVGGRPPIPPIQQRLPPPPPPQSHSTSNLNVNTINVGPNPSSSSLAGGLGTCGAGSSWVNNNGHGGAVTSALSPHGGSVGGGSPFFNGHSGGNGHSTYEPLFLAFSETTAPPPTPTSPTTTIPQAPNTGLLRRRSEHRRSGSRREQARRAASVGPSIVPRQTFPVSPAGHVMSLREQQVVRLEKEIAHAAGVRLTLRKKDCLNSIAFVNCFSQVYVAGWKQREHPYLHNTFHLGDRLISIGGSPVHTAAEAHSIIKSEDSLLLEFVVRRIPFGKVFALKREDEGQPLGIVREGNTAEIREVVSGGLAETEGLPPRAQTVDGLSVTSWVLTEINHRPLNLFFKHNEIHDRLNAVGRDISILVQPQDLVRQLKKQLKAIKGYKDYIVM